ncbi:hypothetical protein EV2_022058 [Malus domestica]
MTAPIIKVKGVLGMITIRLREDNFAKLAFQFQSILRGYKLFDHFDGSTPCPTKFVISPNTSVTKEITVEYLEWEAIDMALLSLLLATLIDEAMKVNHLKIELHTIQKGSDTIDKYLLRLKHIREQLSAAGEMVSDNDIMIAGLAGLPKEYEVIRIVILARESILTLKEFRALLLSVEREIEGELNAITQNLSALYVQGSSSGTIIAIPYGSTSSSHADQQPYYSSVESYGYGFNAHSGGQNVPRSQSLNVQFPT